MLPQLRRVCLAQDLIFCCCFEFDTVWLFAIESDSGSLLVILLYRWFAFVGGVNIIVWFVYAAKIASKFVLSGTIYIN